MFSAVLNDTKNINWMMEKGRAKQCVTKLAIDHYHIVRKGMLE